MSRIAGSLLNLSLAAVLLIGAGCAATSGGSSVPDDPDLIRKEIVDINYEIRNLEEMYKASLTEMQMEEDGDLRREVNEMWMDLEHLRSRKAALEERLAELEAAQQQ